MSARDEQYELDEVLADALGKAQNVSDRLAELIVLYDREVCDAEDFAVLARRVAEDALRQLVEIDGLEGDLQRAIEMVDLEGTLYLSADE